MTESILQGLLGTAAGLVFGYLISRGLLQALTPVLNRFVNVSFGPPVVSPTILIISILLGVGVTVLAGLLPAIQASRVTPLEALRPMTAEATFTRTAWRGLIIGSICLVLAILAIFSKNLALITPGGLLFLAGLVLVAPALVRPLTFIFSRLLTQIYARQGTGALAEGNLNRQPTRAAITASTTLVGLAVIVAAGALTSSVSIGFLDVLKKTLGSDYLLIPPSISIWGSDMGASPKLADGFRQIKGVDTVSTLRFASSSTEANSLMAGKFSQSSSPSGQQEMAVSILGIDPVAYPKVSGLYFAKGNEKQAYTDLSTGRNAIINGVLAAAAGLKIGDELVLSTPQGKQSYQVVAIASDFLDAKRT